MKFPIRRWTDNEVLFEAELPTSLETADYDVQLGEAVKIAIRRDANLDGANLDRINLERCNLNEVRFDGASLNLAKFYKASIQRASFRGVSLYGASFCDAYLNLTSFDGAAFEKTYLDRASLHRVTINGAILDKDTLYPFMQDFIAEVLRLPNELEGLRQAIVDGNIDGSTYAQGECSCLAGTFSKLCKAPRIKHGDTIERNGIKFHAHASSPREQWFTMICSGDKPENNQASRIALEWLDEAIAIRDMIRATAS